MGKLENDMSTYKIEVAFDACGDQESLDQFVEWLNEIGHDAKAGNTTGSYVDGRWTSTDSDANQIMNSLWDEFCASI